MRFRAALEELGTTFVKLGQLLSSRPDLLPDVYIEELDGSSTTSRPLPFAPLREVIEREIGLDHFASIDEEPLATASIAQIHGGAAEERPRGRHQGAPARDRRAGAARPRPAAQDGLGRRAALEHGAAAAAERADRGARAAPARRARLRRGGAQRRADRGGARGVPRRHLRPRRSSTRTSPRRCSSSSGSTARRSTTTHGLEPRARRGARARRSSARTSGR